MPKVYILILNYKRWRDVAACLEALFQSSYTHFTAIVIDNDSDNQSLEHLMNWADQPASCTAGAIHKPISYEYYKSSCLLHTISLNSLPQLLLVQNEMNKGFAGGINTVLKYFLEENAFIWLLNPDIIVQKSTLSELVKYAESHNKNSIIGCVIKQYTKPSKIHTYGGGKINFRSATVQFITDKKDVGNLDYISGGSLFTHAGTYADVGLLPEDYFLYWEETDWCYRAKKRGYKLLVCETAVCYDKISTSIGKNYLSDYYYTRN